MFQRVTVVLRPGSYDSWVILLSRSWPLCGANSLWVETDFDFWFAMYRLDILYSVTHMRTYTIHFIKLPLILIAILCPPVSRPSWSLYCEVCSTAILYTATWWYWPCGDGFRYAKRMKCQSRHDIWVTESVVNVRAPITFPANPSWTLLSFLHW